MSKDWKGDTNSVYKIIGASNHAVDGERQEEDFYATDSIAIDKLLQVEKSNWYIWECACGAGHLSQRLKDLGFQVKSSDIIDRGYPDTIIQNFLETNDENFYGDILTNPPYKYAKEFVLKALDIVKPGAKVYMFLKLTFLEGKARYKELFSKYPPKCVYVFSERVMCAKNGDFEDVKDGGGSAVAYAWFVWEKGYNGETVVRWI